MIPPPSMSRDLQRVLGVPRRKLDPTDASAAEKWTAKLRSWDTVPCSCYQEFGFCIKTLLPLQGWGLEEASSARGLLGLIHVGGGKTGLDVLLPMVVPNCKVALLLIPPNLRAQFLQRDYYQWARHFNVPNLAGGRFTRPGVPVLHVIAYSELSTAKSTDLLKRLAPDLVIADEAHNLRRSTAARTKRFLRHFAAQSGTRLAALSGTLTNRSIRDYAHLAKLALGDGSPLPLNAQTVEEWAGVLDANATGPVGDLDRLCEQGEQVRDGYRRRLIATPGVVASELGTLGTSLVISERLGLVVPPAIRDALEHVRRTWQRPDGEELEDPMAKARVCRELAAGFYYRWIWPRREPQHVIEAWLVARAAWHKEIREKLKTAREHTDSPLLLARAAIRWFDGFVEVLPDGARVHNPPGTRHRLTWASQTFQDWRRLKDSAEPQTEAVWLSDYLLEDVAKWAKGPPGLVWYDHVAFGERLAKLTGLAHFGPGKEANEGLLTERGSRTIILSARAHGQGKNLQPWARNLICTPPGSGKDWEQLIGRSHRHGQKADEVTVDLYLHTEELAASFQQALLDARYIQSTTGVHQKLIYATKVLEVKP